MLNFASTRSWALVAVFTTSFSIFAAAQVHCPEGRLGGQQLGGHLYQLTGTDLVPGQTSHPIPELADPAPPFVNSKGEVEIYGSAPHALRYPSWEEFERGGCYEVVPVRMKDGSSAALTGTYDEPWDVRKYRILRKTSPPQEVLLGGVMSSDTNDRAPEWPVDNPRRRIYFFRPADGLVWLRDALPVLGRIATGWLGHSYGGNLAQEDMPDAATIQADEPGRIGFFSEQVSEVRNGWPYKTEIFAVQMRTVDKVAVGVRVPIFTFGEKPFPANRRTLGGLLAEGPRPLQVKIEGQNFYLLGFSSGDFPTDAYGMNFLWSKSLFGPYTPFLTADQSDLFDFGQGLKSYFALSWVGRPALFQTPDGRYEMLFHGVKKSILPDNDYSHWPTRYNLWDFYRSVFKVDVQLGLTADGTPKLRMDPGALPVQPASREGTVTR